MPDDNETNEEMRLRKAHTAEALAEVKNFIKREPVQATRTEALLSVLWENTSYHPNAYIPTQLIDLCRDLETALSKCYDVMGLFDDSLDDLGEEHAAATVQWDDAITHAAVALGKAAATTVQDK